MAKITINEQSRNYSYNVGTSSFATVALPITASWGPGLYDPKTVGADSFDDLLETVVWERFASNQAGMEAFLATYRGPASNYRLAKDFSFYQAQTLLASGYDILVCRIAPGSKAGKSSEDAKLTITAKYPGTFGNNLQVVVQPVTGKDKRMNVITYVLDASGTRTAVENILMTTDIADSSESIPYIDEVESNFIDITIAAGFKVPATATAFALENGTDYGTFTSEEVINLAKDRYGKDHGDQYIKALTEATKAVDAVKLNTLGYREFVFNGAIKVYDLLRDKLSYSPNRVISPGWDDQDIAEVSGTAFTGRLTEVSPIHKKLMETAYYSRCATALIDVPKCLQRSKVYNEVPAPAGDAQDERGYAQILSAYRPGNATFDLDENLFASHSALFAPWGNYTYVGTSKMQTASPAFLTLLIQRSMLLKQAAQYEWLLPSKRSHTVNVGKLDYTIGKKQLDEWQKLEGVGVNMITNIPDIGPTLWGNSTLFDVPPATYQALANLSTRYVFNAVKDVVYRAGIQVTFTYNNADAYSSFRAGCEGLLDLLQNQGAITKWEMRMSADINGYDSVNANTIIGEIILHINGVVNDIVIDLVALPPVD